MRTERGGESGFELADMEVPLGLHLLDGAEALFEGREAASSLDQVQGLPMMARTFEDEVGQ